MKDPNFLKQADEAGISNPAFRRSDISIGILSEKRLNPKLACKYNIEFKDLSIFLNRLLENGLIFSENLLKF
ncbi:MAG: hypothetical protein GEU26_08165 [Nitrososphaeraceae archaeon]|nr:hypothetical protein [Nitrososphaeraceae archaeon]